MTDLKDAICRRAVMLQHAIGDYTHRMDQVAVVVRAEWRGEIAGLRFALCLLHDIDPVANPEAWLDKESPMDEHVKAWHNRHCTRSDCEGPW